MCGIFGLVGFNNKATEIVLNGLKKLEYRGYDSFGIGIQEKANKTFTIHRQTGEIEHAKNPFPNLQTNFAIGHTRWATHGGVTEENAHPHTSNNKEIILVHNGIFENHQEVRKQLIEKGYHFDSETDTEVAAVLLEELLKTNSTIKALQILSQTLHGRYALVVKVLSENKLYTIRNGSPVIIGVTNKNHYFIASDIPAFLEHTNIVNYLDDNQIVEFTIENDICEKKFYDTLTLQEISKRDIQVDLNKEDSELGEFEHFMIKEIMEQKESLLRACNQDPELISEIASYINNSQDVYFVGCGTTGVVSMCARYLFAKIAKKKVHFEYGSEFSHLNEILEPNSVVIGISQSGETIDTLEAIEMANSKNCKTVCITNVENSTISRASDKTILINAGIEKAVASTKATTSQIGITMLLAFACINKSTQAKQILHDTSGKINDMLNPRYENILLKLAAKIKDTQDMYIIGKGINFPVAKEAAIKIQEITYIHAEAFAGGELKHGPLALIKEKTPVIAIASIDENYVDIISNATEIKSRGGFIIGISPKPNEIFDIWLKVPEHTVDAAIINLIPIQLLSYFIGILKNNNPDKPRNLAKSVTVK
jgi:glutamine---fructose-6-phosphate transaminase (isomerizing)